MSAQVTLYYDGACPICRREAKHYRKLVGEQTLALTDIAEAGFDAAQHGLDGKRVQQSLHAKLADGQVVTGVDAFAAIRPHLPGRSASACTPCKAAQKQKENRRPLQ